MIQTLENFLRPYVERHPQTWSQYLALAEFAANNVVNVGVGYSPFYLNSGDHPLVPSVLMHGRGVSSKIEAVQTMVGPDEDRPGGSSGQSHRRSGSGQIIDRPLEAR